MKVNPLYGKQLRLAFGVTPRLAQQTFVTWWNLYVYQDGISVNWRREKCDSIASQERGMNTRRCTDAIYLKASNLAH
jgi:hypothetical protein